jgi:hypothetical protein
VRASSVAEGYPFRCDASCLCDPLGIFLRTSEWCSFWRCLARHGLQRALRKTSSLRHMFTARSLSVCILFFGERPKSSGANFAAARKFVHSTSTVFVSGKDGAIQHVCDNTVALGRLRRVQPGAYLNKSVQRCLVRAVPRFSIRRPAWFSRHRLATKLHQTMLISDGPNTI